MAGGSLINKLKKGFGEFIDAGLVEAPSFLETRWTAELFGGHVESGRRRFVEFVDEGIQPVPGTGG